MSVDMQPAAGGEVNVAMRRVAAASFVGALLEWYDFYAFAMASALVFGPLFFPSDDPLLSTMASFGAFASGFLARPIGALIFGDIGDRIGRRASLIATLVIIGVGTFLIGVLPTFAQSGIWAPTLLVILRVVQGIGLGGEYAGGSLITIEHAPSGRRGFWGSLAQAASPGGLLLASLVFELITLLPPGAFIAWGWRVPFLLSVIMLGVGLYVRLHVAETPEFEAIRGQRTELPIVDLLRTHGSATLLATGARLAETVSGNMIKSFGLTYATTQLGLPRAEALGALLTTSIVGMLVTPLYGVLGDHFGPRAVYMAGAGFTALLAFPFFWILEGRTVAALWIGFVVAYNLGPTLMLSVQPTFFTTLFHPRVRYTGLSIAYQVSAIVGGFTPLISLTFLQQSNGAPWGVATFLAAMAVLSFSCAAGVRGAPRESG
jgi:MHS family shikimate/dehydroshikimate transporter-like MFS transporter